MQSGAVQPVSVEERDPERERDRRPEQVLVEMPDGEDSPGAHRQHQGQQICSQEQSAQAELPATTGEVWKRRRPDGLADRQRLDGAKRRDWTNELFDRLPSKRSRPAKHQFLALPKYPRAVSVCPELKSLQTPGNCAKCIIENFGSA
jgi:hypothetical protein